ncbi:hypothetical protein [Methanoculleus taiwanensis]|uniref:hypothetical protein n=1 Tax=Methanoculleus taiwanensis TaxID=1550565 RepID=UPI000FFE4237|nr:hypothetical protein [Methanoculleus taiwanensis]
MREKSGDPPFFETGLHLPVRGVPTRLKSPQKKPVFSVIFGYLDGVGRKFISELIIGRYIPPREGGVTPMAGKDKKGQAQAPVKNSEKQEKGKRK